MTSDTYTYTATVDRIVDGDRVVVLLEEAGDVVDELVLAREAYPDLEEGDVLTVDVEDGTLVGVEREESETERRRRDRRERFERLSERLPDSEDCENSDDLEDRETRE